jgi:hypothetical protein
MSLIRSLRLVLLLSAIAICWNSTASAYIQMPNESVAHRMAVADSVVLGKIVAVEARPVKGQLWRYSEQPQAEFTVVEVEVKETFYGPSDAKRVRFGLVQAKTYDPAPAVGQRGLFCGVKVGKNDFFVVPRGAYCGEDAKPFAQDVEQARRLGRVLAQSKGGLTSKDVTERVLAAHVLILRSMFAPWRFGETGKAEPIDAEQSKLALKALAEADWDKHSQEVREALKVLQWAGTLGAPPPKDLPLNYAEKEWPAAAKQWLRDNAERYRIHRLSKADNAAPKSK